ncbi:hypothetical protein K491DRAFT_769597 [Lophiostoma macrostomum CBS 122681]|uniref:Galactose oxidase n=1 Tax=Lophiostoma macrostomum CBS 122681 TaxID=1314788 RepID=A0A6A6SZP0_9PLEO|nr:hypothetical protein K491DRAFT_769597 [Lophiostoma macrostomum CBS 122681]
MRLAPSWPCAAVLPLVWLFALVSSVQAAQMPYNPTRILQHDDLLYVFQPSSGSTSQFQLGSINISSSIAASNVPYTTLYPILPFLQANTPQAFTPILDNHGNMTVYTGDCANGLGGAEIWGFAPDSAEKDGNGSWVQQSLGPVNGVEHSDVIGANFLAGGMSFSAFVDGDASDTGAYFFGGMCPSAFSSSDWQSTANYSNLMVVLEPSLQGSTIHYGVDVSTSRGPPIAEAGFTLTGLQPSFSNRSDGTQTQQQDFVLIGGHTSAAFINMSQVALYSLPQGGWTFIGVNQPDNQRTDLAIRTDVDQVEPRSGHSAVLTPDGQHLVIFGGWIGDLNTPAEPALAVLNFGEGYGGGGAWEWTVPTTSGSGLSSGSSLYGHGATMLPGGVMMLVGGYTMSSSGSRRRQATGSANTNTLFFNVTSSTWLTDYTPPITSTSGSSSASGDSGPLSTTAQKAGLGAGLGIGMAAVFSLMAFYIWYTRRLKKQHQTREAQLRDLAMSAHRYHLEPFSPGGDGVDDTSDSYFYPGTSQQNRGWRQANGHDAERTGLLVEIPSPTRGLRRSLGGRNGHHISRYDERRVRGSNTIHPIDELDEEQEHEGTTDQIPLAIQPEMREKQMKPGASIFENLPVLDPFLDRNSKHRTPQFHSAPASPVHEVQHYDANDGEFGASAHAALGQNPTSNGRSSPDKSDRTGSNLSERSTRSNLSSNSTSGSIARTASMRSTAILNNASHANPFKSPEGSPTTGKAHRHSGGWESPVDPRTRSLTSVRSFGRPSTANEDKESFATARTSFMQLQAEGEALLGGNPDRVRPDTSSSSNGSNPRGYEDTEPTMNGSSRPRRKSWLGSVRRALARSSTSTDARTRSLTTSIPQLEQYTDNPLSPVAAGSLDRKSFPASAPPRRAASDASFWRSKRGKQDWEDEEIEPGDPRAKWRRTSGDDWGAPEDLALAEKERQRREWRERGNLISLSDEELPTPRTPIQAEDLGDPNRPRTPAGEDDWDVEAAVERRVVQVMFTVPRSKLRVVNADPDRSSILSLPRENSDDNVRGNPGSSPGRVKDLVGRFEPQGTPRSSPRPSPSPSVKSLKVRAKGTSPLLATKRSSSSLSKGKGRLASEDITTMGM